MELIDNNSIADPKSLGRVMYISHRCCGASRIGTAEQGDRKGSGEKGK